MSALGEILMSVIASPFALVVLFGVCAFDGVVSFVPSETVLVAVAAAPATTGQPVLALVLPAAAAGAIVGDNCAYALGRRIGTERFAWMRRPRVAAAFGRARGEMLRRPARLVIAGRYIPFGRVIVNLTAGASGLGNRFFSCSRRSPASPGPSIPARSPSWRRRSLQRTLSPPRCSRSRSPLSWAQ